MTASLSYRFDAGADCLRTRIGSREGEVIRITAGKRGHALYGPYVPLPAGRYVANVRFARERACKGAATIDVCNDLVVLAKHPVRGKDIASEGVARIEFALPDPLGGLEVRLFSDGSFCGDIEAVEIIGVPAVGEPVELSDLPTPRVENAVLRGRNFFEGYQRSMALGVLPHCVHKIDKDPDYRQARDLAGQRTIVSENNLKNLFLIFKFFLPRLPQPAQVVEWGSYRGGGAIFMASLAQTFLPDCQVYGFDTFTGMPPTDARVDQHGGGGFLDGVDLPELRRYVRSIGLDNLEFVQGDFADTAAPALRRIGPVGLAHIDCDIRSAIACAYDATRPYMVPGGYWALDDPLAPDCLGAAEAMEDLLVRRDELNCEQAFPHFVFRQP
jgi:hypothetical protein